MKKYQHYYRLDENNKIAKAFSSADIIEILETDICFNDNAVRHCNVNLWNEKGKLKYKYIDGQAVELTDDEIEPLEDYKIDKIKYIGELSFNARRIFLPDYKLVNANLGVYSVERKTSYKDTIEAFRTEFYRIKGLIETASSKDAVDIYVHQIEYPNAVIES